MRIKWQFRVLNYLICTDEMKLYRLPYDSNNRYYELKRLKEHYHNGGIYINYLGKRYSRKKLNKLAYGVNYIYKQESKIECPF